MKHDLKLSSSFIDFNNAIMQKGCIDFSDDMVKNDLEPTNSDEPVKNGEKKWRTKKIRLWTNGRREKARSNHT